MTQHTCPNCSHSYTVTAKKPATRKTAGEVYTSLPLENGLHQWTTPEGRNFVCSFPVDKKILADAKRVARLSAERDTAGRNARLGYTFEQASERLLRMTPFYVARDRERAANFDWSAYTAQLDAARCEVA